MIGYPVTRSFRELMDLRGRVAVVTGGAGHIGLVVAETLAELGGSVVVVDREAVSCSRIADSLSARHGIEALPYGVDLGSDDSVRRIPEVVREKFGRLDILINCAALVGSADLPGWVSPFEQQSVDVWRMALEINLTAAFVLTQACTPLLSETGRGSIINVASIYGMVGPDWRLYADTGIGSPAAYAASKGGLLQLTRWLATSLAPRIRVNAITPGGVFRDTPEPFLSRYESRTPLGRMGSEEDFKGAAGYLASDLSAYVTGHNLVVDGGWTVW